MKLEKRLENFNIITTSENIIINTIAFVGHNHLHKLPGSETLDFSENSNCIPSCTNNTSLGHHLFLECFYSIVSFIRLNMEAHLHEANRRIIILFQSKKLGKHSLIFMQEIETHLVKLQGNFVFPCSAL